jgi:hypothetical protein
VLAPVHPAAAAAGGGNFWVRIADAALLYVLLASGLNIVVAMPACWTWASSPSSPSAPTCTG